MKGLRRWLTTNGLVGEVPLWYRTIRAARYLKVAPWELAAQSAFWLHAAEEAHAAEVKAEDVRSRQASRSPSRVAGRRRRR